MMFFQQLTGINLIIYFVSTIIPQNTTEDSDGYKGFLSIIANFATTIIVIFIIDRTALLNRIGVGRKILLMIGSISITAILLFCTVCLIFLKNEAHRSSKVFADTSLAVVIIYTALFGISYGPVVYFSLPMIDKYTSVSYTHLTLPTNREV
eukprot:TRINITY_DN11268_c0_g1_i24.p1 TRINITY_DN11268_c0_g1~~TRINITY_DN11268_c0_g1_i24.p1  ORF type:complete len:151 (+),score=6.29 TRINITY_DN11268_c0_g1_i24:195-647(+)